MARTTDKYTFRSRPDDPAPIRTTLVEFLRPHLVVPATTDELLAVLRDWIDPDDMPTYHALFNVLKRDKRVRGINGPKAKWTTMSESDIDAALADHPSAELLAAVGR